MSRLLASEMRKLTASPTMWWLLLGTTLLAAAATVGAMVLVDARGVSQVSEQALRGDLHAVGSGSILVAIAGIIGMAGEFRNGQADQTFISEPRRGRVLAAKLFVFTVLGAIFGILSAAATLLTMWIGIEINGETLRFGDSLIWSTIGGAIASAAVFGALGVGIGAVSRNQVAAIVGALAWIVVLEPIVLEASTTLGRWLPGAAAQALRRIPEEGLLSMGTGAAVFGGWTIAALLAAHWRSTRTDIV